MNPATKAALQIVLNETISKRDQLLVMTDQYKKRAHVIENVEVAELEVKIEQLRGDLK